MSRTVAIFCAFAAVAAAHAEAPWLSSLDKATQIAKQTGRPLLVLFTGSDWCPPCKMLESHILRTPVFENWAKQHVVLLRLDFPRSHPQPAALQAANERASMQFGVHSFPTVLFVAPTGQVIGREAGYSDSGPSFWTKNAELIISRGMQRFGR